MKNLFVILLAFASTFASAQCTSDFIVSPHNLWEEVFTFEMDQIFDGQCFQAVEPFETERLFLRNIMPGSTFVITVSEGGEVIDKFVINPGPVSGKCPTWVVNQPNGNRSTLAIK